MRVLITGATGFIGSVLTRELQQLEWFVVPVVRDADKGLPNQCVVPDIGPTTDWRKTLTGMDCVVHLAGRAHVIPLALCALFGEIPGRHSQVTYPSHCFFWTIPLTSVAGWR